MPDEPEVPLEPDVPDEPAAPDVPDEPFAPEVPEEPLEPEVPDEPLPPLAPSKLTVQDVYVPLPTVLVGAANCNAPVLLLYVITSHSWKFEVS